MSNITDERELLSGESRSGLTLTPQQQCAPVWEWLDEVLGPVPPEEMDRVPYDAAEHLDAYLYGTPKEGTE